MKVDLTSDFESEIEDDAATPAAATNPNQQRDPALSDISGHVQNPDVWQERYMIQILDDFGSSVTPWESGTINDLAYLQEVFDTYYTTGHIVEPNGAIHRLVSLPLVVRLSKLTLSLLADNPICLTAENQYRELCDRRSQA